jgi:hypothetical protein
MGNDYYETKPVSILKKNSFVESRNEALVKRSNNKGKRLSFSDENGKSLAEVRNKRFLYFVFCFLL